MSDAYYRRTATGYEPTQLVAGPWSPDASHAGPPSAILIQELARAADPMLLTRVTNEIPGPIPIVPYEVDVEVVKPGRRVQMLRAVLRIAGSDTAVMTSSAWAMRVKEGMPSNLPHADVFPPPEECEVFTYSMTYESYMNGVEMRRIEGTPFGGGEAAIWIRQTKPLIDGEEADPYTLCGMFGDLGNGISAIAPLTEIAPINTDITLYLVRRPHPPWIAMKSLTISHGLGLGMTDSLVYDVSGFVGRANQSILIDRR